MANHPVYPSFRCNRNVALWTVLGASLAIWVCHLAVFIPSSVDRQPICLGTLRALPIELPEISPALLDLTWLDLVSLHNSTLPDAVHRTIGCRVTGVLCDCVSTEVQHSPLYSTGIIRNQTESLRRCAHHAPDSFELSPSNVLGTSRFRPHLALIASEAVSVAFICFHAAVWTAGYYGKEASDPGYTASRTWAALGAFLLGSCLVLSISTGCFVLMSPVWLSVLVGAFFCRDRKGDALAYVLQLGLPLYAGESCCRRRKSDSLPPSVPQSDELESPIARELSVLAPSCTSHMWNGQRHRDEMRLSSYALRENLAIWQAASVIPVVLITLVIVAGERDAAVSVLVCAYLWVCHLLVVGSHGLRSVGSDVLLASSQHTGDASSITRLYWERHCLLLKGTGVALCLVSICGVYWMWTAFLQLSWQRVPMTAETRVASVGFLVSVVPSVVEAGNWFFISETCSPLVAHRRKASALHRITIWSHMIFVLSFQAAAAVAANSFKMNP